MLFWFQKSQKIVDFTKKDKSFLTLWNLKIWQKDKIPLIVIFVNYDSQQFLIYVDFHDLLMPQSVAMTLAKNRELSPSFGEKLIKWAMVGQMRHFLIIR